MSSASLSERLKLLYRKVTAQANDFYVAVPKQAAFLSHFPEPRDDIERSYFQYRCQMFCIQKWLPPLMNLASLALSAIYRLKIKPSVDVGTAPADAVFLFAGPISILPPSLSAQYQILQRQDFQAHMSLTQEDRAYLKELRRRYPFAFYYRFKCMLKVAMYSDVLTRHAPKAVICSEEYSFTSSLLTDYCERRGVAHINVMHGDKWYNILDSFFLFHRCYIWDEHYRSLFTDMRAEPSQFLIEIPPSLRFPLQSTTLPPVDYTYYLQDQPTEFVLTVLHYLSILKARGTKVAVRPHPVFQENSAFLYKDDHGLII